MATPPRPHKGDIILFPFPYTDQKGSKIRPCLVLSAPRGADNILCQITSQRTRKDEYSVILNQEDTLQGSLMLDSYIRCDMLFTADTTQTTTRTICSIKKEKYQEVIETILEIIK